MTTHKHCLDPNCLPACAEDCCVREESANQPVKRTEAEWSAGNCWGERADEEPATLSEALAGANSERDAASIFAAKADERVKRAEKERDEAQENADRWAVIAARAHNERDRFRDARAASDAHYEMRLKDFDQALARFQQKELERMRERDEARRQV